MWVWTKEVQSLWRKFCVSVSIIYCHRWVYIQVDVAALSELICFHTAWAGKFDFVKVRLCSFTYTWGKATQSAVFFELKYLDKSICSHLSESVCVCVCVCECVTERFQVSGVKRVFGLKKTTFHSLQLSECKVCVSLYLVWYEQQAGGGEQFCNRSN